MPEIFYIMNNEGDWCGLYVNGELIYEGHSIPPFIWQEAIEKLGHTTSDKYDGDSKLGEFLDNIGGRYPTDLTTLLDVLASG